MGTIDTVCATYSYSVSSSDVNNKTCKQYETNAKQNETGKMPHQTYNLELEAMAAKKYEKKTDEKKTHTPSIMNEACRSQFVVFALSVVFFVCDCIHVM